MAEYRDFAYVYFQGPYPSFSIQVAELFPEILERFDFHPRNMLDMACGEGSFAIQMALNGLQVTGLDQSPDMLQIARLRSNARGAPVDWIELDMRSLDNPPSFDLVTCLFDSLNYLLEPGDLANTFSRVRQALNPGGLFIFDMNTIYGLSVLWQQTGCSLQQDNEEIVEIHQPNFDYENSIASVKITAFIKDEPAWRRIDEVHQERGYPVEQIRDMLAIAGLDILGCYGSISDFGELQPDSGRVWFVTRKQENMAFNNSFSDLPVRNSVRKHNSRRNARH